MRFSKKMLFILRYHYRKFSSLYYNLDTCVHSLRNNRYPYLVSSERYDRLKCNNLVDVLIWKNWKFVYNLKIKVIQISANKQIMKQKYSTNRIYVCTTYIYPCEMCTYIHVCILILYIFVVFTIICSFFSILSV